MKNINFSNNTCEAARLRIQEGTKRVWHNTFTGIIVQLIYLFFYFRIWDSLIRQNNFTFKNELLNKFDTCVTTVLMYILGCLGYFFVMYLFSQPFLANKVTKNLKRGGLVNYNEEAPLLISRKLEKKIGLTKIYRITDSCRQEGKW